MQPDIDKTPVKVNKILGKRASIGPIPADQMIPWAAIGCLSYFVVGMLLGRGFFPWLVCWVWLVATWWTLTGEKTYAYVKSWVSPPGHDWINAETLFVRATEPGTWKRMRKDRLPFIKVSTENGMKRFAPFQNFAHLHSIAHIELDGYAYGCLILYNKQTDQWSAQIPFALAGIHPQLYRSEVETKINALHRAMSELPGGELLTFHMAGWSSTRERKQQLRDLAEQAHSQAIAVLMLNEQQRVNEISAAGDRQVWEQIAWGSWTAQKNLEEQQDLIGKALLWLQNRYQTWSRSFMGTQEIYFEDFYTKMAREIHESGFLTWRNLLETKAELSIRPLTPQEIWEWLWYRFNRRPAPPLPHRIRITEKAQGLQQQIPPSGSQDLLTFLIQGDQGQTRCPKHKGQHGYVYVNGRVGKVVVVEAPPELWRNAREQLAWVWNRISSSYIRDTEVVVQIAPREHGSTQDELEKMTRQSFTESRRARQFGTGKGVHADLQGEYAEEALRKMLEGREAIYCAPVFILWRDTEAEAEEAARYLLNAFGAAHAVTEEDIAWRNWLESLPINDAPLLTKFSLFSERRLTLDSESVPGFLPLTRPRDLDSQGVEFATDRGGHPIYVNILDSQQGRILITGTSGSGKSVMGWRFIQDALAQNVPVVGIDLSSGGNSTFQTAVQMLGTERGAYVDILRESLNPLEPPDLRALEPRSQIQRLKRWKDLARTAIVTIAMGEIEDPALKDRVDSLCLRLLEVFFEDVEIVSRYNEAFEGGWQSAAWQRMPTLHDLLKFCSREKLKLESYEDTDAAAINQIVNQIGAKLMDPNIGSVLGRPSSVSPHSLITFYALSGLTNDQNAVIMAMSAQMACLRNALAHPRSLFVGDEMSVLLNKRGFADLTGELLATGRKEGVSVLILTQDLDAILDCSARAKILANLTTTITGLTTHAAIPAYVNALDYPSDIITQNATERFLAIPSEYCSRWLVERNNRFWDCRFYAAPMMLAALANSEAEKAARARVMANYPHTELGYLQGLRAFTEEYVLALKGSQSLEAIGQQAVSYRSQEPTPQAPTLPRQLTH